MTTALTLKRGIVLSVDSVVSVRKIRRNVQGGSVLIHLRLRVNVDNGIRNLPDFDLLLNLIFKPMSMQHPVPRPL